MSRTAARPCRVPLRIDVDFHAGLVRAVPRMLDALAARGMQASFFVVAGVNRPSTALKRLLDANYRNRLLRLGPLRIWKALREDRPLGIPGMLDDDAACESLLRIEREGHELAVHGFDHAWWADSVWSAAPERLEREIDRAYATIEQVAGKRVRAWGSPNWRTRDEVLRALVGRGVPYLSECWGRTPFLTQGTLHLPVTDCLEPWYLERPGESHECVVRTMLARRDAGPYRLLCVHDYFEGLIVPELFPALLDGLHAGGMQARSLASVALELSSDPWREETLSRGVADGFCGEVSWQPDAQPSMLLSAP